MSILYFEGAGWSDADISKATIGNCRIRTAFRLDDGRAMYLEIVGSERTKRSSPAVHKWQYTGFVWSLFYVTDEEPNDDENNHSVHLSDSKRIFEYTEEAILKLVNSLGASFTAVKVVPDLGGYRVFPGDYTRNKGTARFNYGDEFQFDPEMTARREAVHKAIYDLELRELEEDRRTGARKFVHSPSGRDFPNFSLWVDEKDPGMLHLLRHFNAHNRHWSIRTDVGENLEDWLATATETRLGSCGC